MVGAESADRERGFKITENGEILREKKLALIFFLGGGGGGKVPPPPSRTPIPMHMSLDLFSWWGGGGDRCNGRAFPRLLVLQVAIPNLSRQDFAPFQERGVCSLKHTISSDLLGSFYPRVTLHENIWKYTVFWVFFLSVKFHWDALY